MTTCKKCNAELRPPFYSYHPSCDPETRRFLSPELFEQADEKGRRIAVMLALAHHPGAVSTDDVDALLEYPRGCTLAGESSVSSEDIHHATSKRRAFLMLTVEVAADERAQVVTTPTP